MPFLKEDMNGRNYNWPDEGAATVFSGTPSRRLFDRFNGNQVLFLINYFGTLSERFSNEEARKLEDMLTNDLPMEAQSEISVLNWMKSVTATASAS